MTAIWGDDVAPVVIHISVSQKVAILAQVPKPLVRFNLENGEFTIATCPYLLFRTLHHPGPIQPRELTTSDVSHD